MNMPGLEAAKAYAALIGSITTALLGVYTADSTVGQVLTTISAIATGFATWKVENRPAVRRGERRSESGESALMTAVLIAALVLLILLIVGEVR